MTTTALQAAEANLEALLAEQKQAHLVYEKRQSGENYEKILKLRKLVNKARAEVARNK
jgi:hypothetical protein